MNEILLDDRFQSLLPPLDAETYSLLEESLLEHGCLTPLVVWNGILVDGYNRYRICMEHDIPFTIVNKDFRTRDHALIWIISNQISRRNLNPLQLSRFRGMHYKSVKSIQGADRRLPNESEEYQIGTRAELTAGQLGAFYGVSRNTIFRDIKVADAFDAIGEVSPEAMSMVLSSEVSMGRGKLESLASAPREKVEAVTSAILDGTYNKKAPLSPQPAEDGDPSGVFLTQIRKMDSLIRAMTNSVNSALHGNSTGGFSELRTALRSCIITLEGFYSSIPE